MVEYFSHCKNWLMVCVFVLGISFAMLLANPAAIVDAQGSAQLSLLQSDSTRIVLELQVAGYDVRPRTINGARYVELVIPGLDPTGESGKPQLPVKGTLIGIPPGAQASLKIIADDSQTAALASTVLPVPTERVEQDPTQSYPHSTDKVYLPDVRTYSSNQFSPAQAVQSPSVGNWRSQHYLNIVFYPLQFNPVTRQLVFHRRLRVEITLTYPKGQTREALGGAVNEGAFESVFQNSILNYSSAKNWRSQSASVARSAQKSAYSGGPWYKVAVNSDGMYRITCTQLQAAGINTSALVSNTLRLFKQGTELATWLVWQDSVCDDNHYLLFWGQGANIQYTDTNIYWLTFGATNGTRMVERDGSIAGSSPDPFTTTLHLEQEHMYRSALPYGVEDGDHWYWNLVGYGNIPSYYYCQPCSYSFSSPPVATGDYSATLTLDAHGFTYAGFSNHDTVVMLNGNTLISQTWSGQIPFSTTVTFPQSYLTSTNTITVTEMPDSSGNKSIVFLNSFDISYSSGYTATNDMLRFRQVTTGTWQYQISGFVTSTIQAFDITNPMSVTHIANTLINSGSTYSLQFGDNTLPPREYVALTTAQYKTPLSITPYSASDLTSTSNAADYIFVSYGAFTSTVKPLADFRKSQGLNVKVVDVQDVYDQFNDGVLDPVAIKNFLAYAQANWVGPNPSNPAPKPSLALLVGDGTFDPKGYCSTSGACESGTTPANSLFIPAYMRMVDPFMGETASDNRYVSFNDGTCVPFSDRTGTTDPNCNLMPGMMIGRLPVNSTAELTAMVTKIMGYETNSPSGRWRSQVSFVADAGYDASGVPESAGNFWSISDSLVDNSYYVPPSISSDRIYYNPCPPSFTPDGGVTYPCNLPYSTYSTTSATHDAVMSAINSGRLIVNYIGHSAINFWDHSFLANSDISALTNGNRLPVMLEMTCFTGSFQNIQSQSLGEVNVRQPNGGAVASWSATGLGVADGHDYLDKAFFEAIMQKSKRRLGDAVIAGKANLYANDRYDSDLIDTFVLLGDPATLLQIQFPTFLPLIFR